VKGINLVGMIIAIYDDEPYAHMLTITQVLADIKAALSDGNSIPKVDLPDKVTPRKPEKMENKLTPKYSQNGDTTIDIPPLWPESAPFVTVVKEESYFPPLDSTRIDTPKRYLRSSHDGDREFKDHWDNDTWWGGQRILINIALSTATFCIAMVSARAHQYGNSNICIG
jgi:hypothetical protein